MKSGFYLSPDGLHIVEICKSENTDYLHTITFCNNVIIHGIGEFRIGVLFSAWELLDE